MKFRQDINGLRAIAVMTVVLFHFQIFGFGGGFIGVDIFFVISGFLMTKIIDTRLNENAFSVLDFYLARARRIIPPLAVLCIFILILGWFTLAPIEYKSLGKHVFGSITFLSNHIYQMEAGYFDVDSFYKILLHTWSLSAEWQFYLLYPIVFLIFRKNIFKALIALTILSFLISLYFSYVSPSKAYFMFYCRAWEMLAGGVVYFLQISRKKEQPIFLWAGLTIIAVSLIIVDKTVMWPGYMALLPIIGTAFVIYSNVQNNFILSNKVSAYLGKSSYSIYLWHWPIFAFMNIYSIEVNSFNAFLGILLALGLGFSSYELVEKRLNIRSKKIKGVIVFASITMIISTPALAVFLKKGVENRVSDEVLLAQNFSNDRNIYHEKCLIKSGTKLANCYIGRKDNSKDPSIIIIGDSHSDASLTAVIESLPDENNGVLFLGYQNCLPIQNVNIFSETPGFSCGQYNKKVFDFLKTHHKDVPVLIISRTSAYIYGTKESGLNNKEQPLAWFSSNRPEKVTEEYLKDFENQYKNALCSYSGERKVYVTYPYPGFSYDIPKQLGRDLMLNDSAPRVTIDRAIYEDRNAFVKKQINDAKNKCNVNIIDPTLVYCDKKFCYGSESNKSYYYDGTHLSEFGNKKMIPLFEQIFN